ncbi:unnamed protein product [Ilex paraguariensis]|uniref:Bifunctional inhibitor/plant lipid transfer protein/seed storage helical domain-containing protein n=1 Tax=Ilex paraguariensis TaxID=185542 RepID=A0ABC8TVN2_9AQUA
MSSLIMAVALLALLSIGTVMGQSTSCITKLVPCGDYLNSTNTPPSSCCDPVKEVVMKELPCLCTIYETPGLLAQVGINITQALAVAVRCGVPADLSTCNATAPIPSSVPPPPGVPGNDGNRVGGIAWTGLSGILLLCASSGIGTFGAWRAWHNLVQPDYKAQQVELLALTTLPKRLLISSADNHGSLKMRISKEELDPSSQPDLGHKAYCPFKLEQCCCPIVGMKKVNSSNKFMSHRLMSLY